MSADNPALKQRFDRHDKDGDGRIDEQEFGKLLDELGLGYVPAQVRAAFHAIDRDGSGFIEFGEFLKWWTHH